MTKSVESGNSLSTPTAYLAVHEEQGFGETTGGVMSRSIAVLVAAVILAAAIVWHSRTGRYEFHTYQGVVERLDTRSGVIDLCEVKRERNTQASRRYTLVCDTHRFEK